MINEILKIVKVAESSLLVSTTVHDISGYCDFCGREDRTTYMIDGDPMCEDCRDEERANAYAETLKEIRVTIEKGKFIDDFVTAVRAGNTLNKRELDLLTRAGERAYTIRHFAKGGQQ